jgi:hypothetical protein
VHFRMWTSDGAAAKSRIKRIWQADLSACQCFVEFVSQSKVKIRLSLL